jgi:4-amino-4-deoxychorismate lyase
MLDLPAPDEAGYRRAVDAVLAAWDWAAHPEAVLRMILTRGPEGTAGEPNGWVMAAPLDAASRRQRSEGVRVLLLDRGFEGGEIADLPWLLPGAKSLSYGINMAAKRYAVANGADDVIFRAPSGKLLEGPTSSVVLDLDGVLVTPPLDGILRSITIEELVNGAPAAGLEVRIQELHRDDLGRCRGAWLLSSGRILARVTHVDGQELPSSPLDVRLSRLLGVPWR